ncbi:MAG: hypothetical protein HUK00_10155 [Bacteroidaceae bacterium]|nr:hypothetical protein [Bacteroidaceae bacterium]
MTKDKALEDVFLSHKPVFDDQEEFMRRLEQKLDAVEYIRRYEEARLRRLRYAIALAFVLGIASGGALLVFLISTPWEVPMFSLSITNGFLGVVQQNLRLIASIALMLFLSYAVVAIVGNVLDIWNERDAMREEWCRGK